MLRTEKIKIGEREIIIKEISCSAQFRLDTLGKKRTAVDVIKESMSSEDWEYLETIGFKDSGAEKITPLIVKLNGWNDGGDKK